VEKVEITELREQTFYARIILSLNGQQYDIDARPSDSIALALKAKARIFVNEDLFNLKETDNNPDLPQAMPTDPESLRERLKRINLRILGNTPCKCICEKSDFNRLPADSAGDNDTGRADTIDDSPEAVSGTQRTAVSSRRKLVRGGQGFCRPRVTVSGFEKISICFVFNRAKARYYQGGLRRRVDRISYFITHSPHRFDSLRSLFLGNSCISAMT